MRPRDLLTALEKVAEAVPLVVRYDTFELRITGGRGGLCRIRGRCFVLMDDALPRIDKACVLAEALGRFDLTRISMDPELRAFVARGGPLPRRDNVDMHLIRPLARARPRIRRQA